MSKLPAPIQSADVKRAAKVADIVFGTCGTVALSWEIRNILNRVPGDTITERTRHYFQVKGPLGSAIFMVTLGTGTVWFGSHILHGTGHWNA